MEFGIGAPIRSEIEEKEMRITLWMIFLFVSSICMAQENVGPGAKVVWDLNLEPDVEKYELFSAATSGAQDLTGVPLATIAHPTSEWLIDTEGVYFMVLRAVDTFGNSSGPSNEISFNWNSSAPSAPLNLRIITADGIVINIASDEFGNTLDIEIIPAPEPAPEPEPEPDPNK